MASRFLLTTLGSLGDLHPYIAVGLGLRDRGHQVTIATSGIYRAKVEGEGLDFRPVRPDFSAVIGNEAIMRRAMHPRTGTAYIMRKLFLPCIEQSYEDILDAARDADLIVGHGIAFSVPTVAEVLRKPWISVALQPMAFLSAYDPPSIGGMPVLDRLHGMGPRFWRPFMRLARFAARRWGAPVNALRKRLGLPPFRNPLIDDMYSAAGTQAWFSRVFAESQPDWFPNTAVTGFPFYDKLQPGDRIDPRLLEFLNSGPPPVVFTLGSSAVFDAGGFYSESLSAVQKTGCRAVLLIGSDARNRLAGRLPDTVFISEYAPYSELFPRAAATVHQGGIGTTAQALRAGKPMLVVPWSHDQPDNARRIARMGVGRVIPRSKYTADRAASELQTLLSSAACSKAAAEAGRRIAGEDGARAACDALENHLFSIGRRRQS